MGREHDAKAMARGEQAHHHRADGDTKSANTRPAADDGRIVSAASEKVHAVRLFH